MLIPHLLFDSSAGDDFSFNAVTATVSNPGQSNFDLIDPACISELQTRIHVDFTINNVSNPNIYRFLTERATDTGSTNWLQVSSFTMTNQTDVFEDWFKYQSPGTANFWYRARSTLQKSLGMGQWQNIQTIISSQIAIGTKNCNEL